MQEPHTDFYNSLLIVLVVYKMKINESPAYRSLTFALLRSKKSTSLFIYDNSPQQQEPLVNTCWSWHYVHDPSNSGVSKAYNTAFKTAKLLNKKWLLLVDQDTIFPEECFDGYTQSISQFDEQIVVPILRDSIGVASPFRFYFGGGQRISNLLGNQKKSLDNFFFHNSGLLVSVDAFERAGLYDEKLPLDYSDISFVHKLRKGNSHFLLANFYCDHHLASTDTTTLPERLSRFAKFVSASKEYKNQYDPGDLMLSARVFLRSLKLSLQYRNFKFILPLFKSHD